VSLQSHLQRLRGGDAALGEHLHRQLEAGEHVQNGLEVLAAQHLHRRACASSRIKNSYNTCVSVQTKVLTCGTAAGWPCTRCSRLRHLRRRAHVGAKTGFADRDSPFRPVIRLQRSQGRARTPINCCPEDLAGQQHCACAGARMEFTPRNHMIQASVRSGTEKHWAHVGGARALVQ
jgi:hypothetical protein